MSSAPSLALRSLLNCVLRETGLLSPLRRISGATSPVRALAVAAAAKRLGDGTVLLVVPTDADIEAAVGDISFLSGALEASAARWSSGKCCRSRRPGRSVPRLPAAPEGRIGARAGAARAGHDHARVMVASAAACSRGCRSPLDPAVVLRDHAWHRHRSARLANTLVLGGYEPADPVDAHGEFARRGGILTCFPAGEDCRSESSSSATPSESIRRFDPGTQRSIETLDRFGIVPSTRICDLSRGLTPLQSNLFQFLRTRDAQVWVSEPTDVENHITARLETDSARLLRRRARTPAKHPRPLFPRQQTCSFRPMTSLPEIANAVVLEELSIDSGTGSREPGTGNLDLSRSTDRDFSRPRS